MGAGAAPALQPPSALLLKEGELVAPPGALDPPTSCDCKNPLGEPAFLAQRASHGTAGLRSGRGGAAASGL